MDMGPSLAVRLNAVALYAISALLLVAFYWQLAYDELPCPLCLLQRVAFTALAVGPVLTIRYGPKPLHYGLVIVAALLGASVAGRQVLLHVMPGDAGFGSAFWGYHFYTWAFIAFAAAILAAGVMLMFNGQFTGHDMADEHAPGPSRFETGAVWLVIALTLLNALSAFAECGFSACPGNPVHYELFR